MTCERPPIVLERSPVDVSNVFYRTPIFARLSRAATETGVEYYSLEEDLGDATLWEQDASGEYQLVPAEVTLELEHPFDHPLWSIVPDERLAPLTAYQARFEYCDEAFVNTFTTGPAGEPVQAEAFDATYAVKLDEADFGWDPLNDAFGNLGREILVQTHRNDEGQLRLRMAWSEVASSEQDLCAATGDGVAWAFDNPWFEGGVVLDDYDSPPDDPNAFPAFQVSGAFGPDPTRLYGVDLRLQEDCHPDSPPMECIPCELPIEGSGCPFSTALTTPTERLDTPIVPRTWAQIAADPACASPGGRCSENPDPNPGRRSNTAVEMARSGVRAQRIFGEAKRCSENASSGDQRSPRESCLELGIGAHPPRSHGVHRGGTEPREPDRRHR